MILHHLPFQIMFDNDASVSVGLSQNNSSKTLVELFEEMLDPLAEQICFEEFKGGSITYQELNSRANKLARVLQGNIFRNCMNLS